MARLPLALGVMLACISGCSPETHPVPALQAATPEMIPLPNRVASSEGPFKLRPSTQIGAAGGAEARWTAKWLADLLQRTRDLDLRVGDAQSLPSENVILLELRALQDGPVPEGYRLNVSPGRIVVSANDAAGLFYGAVSVWQLASAKANDAAPISIPALVIDDAPRFAWRGLMLDVARHYVAPQYIEQLIDWMALHKLNVLHWHLTDDQGWRLQIKAFPRLTEVGAWRIPAGAAARQEIDPATGEPRRYGGFYTQEEVRGLVAYAAKRHVTIVPEIEMPGHAQAAIAAYPELGVGDVHPDVSSDWGIHNYLFNVEESTFEALEKILAEVLELFPGRYIHVGGDEAVKERWAASEKVQQRMHEFGVGSEMELQSYFIKRIERYLQAQGRRLIGWDEILEGGIAPEATVMSWRGIDGAIEAASLGHDAVLSPGPTLYFDHRQSALASEPPGRGTVVSLEDVYRFDPLPPALAEAGEEHVLGVQANLWSEHIRTEGRLGYMAFPRAAALAEVAWSRPERLDWTHFLRRLVTQFDRYRALGIPFATSAFDVEVAATAGEPGNDVEVELSSQSGLGEIRFTTDGSEVTAESARYTNALQLPADTELSVATFADGRTVSRSIRGIVGQFARRRASHELELCTERLVLSLEDDAPIEGDRSVFLIDVMNPCWIWEGADLSGVTQIKAAVGQVPFNFQIGADREKIELPAPATAAGELEVRANGCDGSPIAVLPLREASGNDGVTVLTRDLAAHGDGPTDLCFRFTADDLDPMWGIDWVELVPGRDPAVSRTR
ncbi:MAG: family 20 glycosylhydrolase [Woeseia sp.]